MLMRRHGFDIPNVDIFRELADTGNLSIAKLCCQFGQCGDFEEGLDLVERFAVGGISYAEAVDGYGAVAVGIGGHIHVTIIEIVVRAIPISVFVCERYSLSL